MDALVDKFLHCDIEEVIHPSGGDQRTHFAEEPCLNRFREYRDANISAAKLLSRDLLAHLDDAVTVNDYLHGFIPPQRINNHGDLSIRPYCTVKNVGIKYDVGIQHDEAVFLDPV